MSKNHNHEGFSLIEILVAILIVAVLAALTIPLFLGARMMGWQAMSTNNLRQLASANMAYAADNGCFVPADDWWNNRRWCGSRVPGQAYDPARGLLADYLGKSKRVTPCPLFTNMLRTQKEKTSFEEGSGGYGYNDYIGGSIAPNYSKDSQRLRISRPVLRLANASTTIMFGTTALARSGGVQEYPYCHPPYWTDDRGTAQTFYGRPSPSLHFRFNGKALVAWCDGHVSAEKLEKRSVGYNPYGGDANQQLLGWFGPDRENGFWNPDASSQSR